MSHMLFLHLYSRHSPGATPVESCVSLSMQYRQVSGMHPVELRADVLPAHADQHLAP